MASNGDQDSQREHRPKRARISQNLFWRPINSEQNSPENQTADKQQLHQPGDADGFLQSSVNRGGIPQLTQLHLGQRGVSNFIDQGLEQPQALIQQQPDTSRGKKRAQQQSARDSHSPEIRLTIPDKLARKRLIDRRYRERKKHEREQTKADLENLLIEHGQLNHEYQKMKSLEKFGAEYHKMKSDVEKFGAEYQKMKSDMEKFGAEYQKMKSDVEKLKAENRQLKDECWKLKSEVEKLKAENGQSTYECQGMRSQVVEPEAENRYSSRKNNDTSRSFTQGCGPPQSSTSGFQNVGPSVQPSNFNPFDDWSHNRDNGVDELGQPMPQLLSMGDHAPSNMPEDGFQNEDMQLNRNHEVLENDDMQLMPGLFSMEGHAFMNMPEDRCTFYPYISSPMSRSLEMLGTEDMQLMSWQFSMEGHASINMHEDGYTFPPYIPSPMLNFDEERSYTGKIIHGWLKIRAVIKWGSVTRKAADTRAQILLS